MRLGLLILLMLPLTARADPGTLTAIATYFGTTVAVVVFSAQVALTVGMAIYGASQQRRAQAEADEQARASRDAFNASLQDRTLTRIASEAAHVYVYGRARVGSAVVAIFTSGARDEFKHLVCIHAAHECDAIEEVYIAGKALGALDGDGFVTAGDYYVESTATATETHTGTSFNLANTPVAGSVSVVAQISYDGGSPAPELVSSSVSGTTVTIDADYGSVTATYQYMVPSNRVRVQKHLGGASDPVDAYLNSILPAKWPATAVLRGFCYTVITLDLNQPEFQGGIPQIEVLVRGKKLFDPRDDSELWSQNPALAIRDYLTSPMCGVDSADIPDADVITAANACDEVITTPAGARYTINGTVAANQAQAQVLEKMAQCMAGGIVSTSWSMWAGKYVAPVLDLAQEDIIGSLAITPGVSDADLYNGVRGQFIGPENSYVSTDVAPYQNPTYVAADGREMWTNIDYPFTDTTQRVHNLARIFTEDQRNGYTVKAEFSLKAWDVTPGSRVTLTSSVFGWSDKVFRVTDKKYSPVSAVELTLKEDAAEIWDQADAVTVDSTPNTDLPNPFVLAALGPVTCESGTESLLIQADGTVVSRILATWTATTDQAVSTNGEIEVQWRLIGSDIWQKTTVAGDDTSAFLTPAEDGQFYLVRVRGVNPYLNVRSDWAYAAAHQVIGKTEAPSTVTSFSIDADGLATWTLVADADVRAGGGYALRWQQGNSRSWGDASPLHDGVLTESPYRIQIRPVGSATFMIKAVDSSGNESAAIAYIVTSLGDPVIDNIVESYDFKDAAWPGSYTGATISGGDLVATADASPIAWDPNPLTAGWTFDTADGWTAITYGSIEYESEIFVVAAADAGAQLTLAATIVGTSYLIEFRRDGDAPGWTDDLELGWTDDADDGWGAEAAWRPWPGALTASEGRYQWRVTIQSRDVQGVISEFTAQLDVVDVVEIVGQVAVLAAGTTIPTTKSWRSIKAIQMNLVSDGGTARTLRIEDRDALLITARDISDAAVDGTALVTIQGY